MTGRSNASLFSATTVNIILFTVWAVCARRLTLLRVSLIASTPHGSFVTTSSFDHESRVSTTQGAGGCYRGIECNHRGHDSCREGLDYRTSQDRLWLCCHSSYANQGMFPVPLPRFVPGSHMARSQRWMNRTISSLDYSVPMSVERLTEGRMERNQTSSVSQCMVR